MNNVIISEADIIITLQRKSGLDIIGDVNWGTHFCQFYETKDDLIDLLVPYFKAGLKNNEYCMWITSEPLGVDEARESLRQVIPDLNNYLNKGQLEIIPYTDWHVIDGNFDSDKVLNGFVDKLNTALANGFDGLRLAGNTFWLEKKYWNIFADYEGELDSVISNYKMLAMCAYCLDRCDARDVIDIVNNHEFALIKREGEWVLFESTKQKKTTYLEKIENIYGNILDNLQDAYIRTDENGIIKMVSPSTVQMYGYDSTYEMIGNPVISLYQNSEDSEFLADTLNKEDKIEDFQSKASRKDDTYFWASINAQFYYEDGQIQGTEFFVRDITEHMETEKKRMRILNTIAEAYVEYDNEWRFVDMNRHFEAIFGYKRDELIGKIVWELLPEAMDSVKYKEVHRAKKENIPVCFETQSLVVGDWFEVYAFPHPDGLTVYLHNITARKKAEKRVKESETRFSSVLRNSQDIIYRFNLQTDNFEYMSPSSEILIYEPEEMMAMSNKEILSHIHPDDRSKVRLDLSEISKKGKGISEYRFKEKDGDYRWLSNKMVIIKDSKGKSVYRDGFIRDITESKKAEEELKLSKERFIKAFKRNAAGMGIVSLNNGQYIEVNESWLEIFGYHTEEVLEHDSLELNIWLNLQDRKRMYEALKTKGYIRQWELPMKRQSGEICIILLSADIMTIADEDMIIASVLDITERKKLKKN